MNHAPRWALPLAARFAGAAVPAPRLRLQARRTRRFVTFTATAGGTPIAGVEMRLVDDLLTMAFLDGDRLPARAGSLTPASALGDVLVERLRAGGHTYEVTPA